MSRKNLEHQRRVGGKNSFCLGGYETDSWRSALAFHVQKVKKDLFIVPATLLEYRRLEKLRKRTDAHRAQISFKRSAEKPGLLQCTRGLIEVSLSDASSNSSKEAGTLDWQLGAFR